MTTPPAGPEEPGPQPPAPPAARVAVSHPSVTAAARRPPRPPRPGGRTRDDLDEQTRLGRVYLRSLMRAQFRSVLVVSVAVGGLLVALPLSFALLPAVRTARLFGVPVPWLLLGAAVYPVLLAAGYFYVRQADRNEAEFTDLVNHDAN